LAIFNQNPTQNQEVSRWNNNFHSQPLSLSAAPSGLDKNTNRQITVKKALRYSRSSRFSQLVNKLGYELVDRDRKQRIIKALSGGDNAARKISKKINGCHCGVRWVDGEAQPFIRSCESRWCPNCARQQATKLRKELFQVVQGVSMASRNRWSFITLTLDPKKLNDSTCKTAFKSIRFNLSRLLKRPEWRDVVDGCFYKIEVTKKGSHWNFHAHIAAVHNCSRKKIDELIRKLWVNSFGKSGAGKIYKIKKFKINKKSILELTKYTVKELDLTDHNLSKVVSVVASRRLRGASGIIRQQLAYIRNIKAPGAKVPAPPRNFDEKTGEFFKLPNGRYSREELLARIANNGCRNALYSLELMDYRFRYGWRHEEALEALKTAPI